MSQPCAQAAPTNTSKAVRPRFFYGWVVVAVCTLVMLTNSAVFNSFGVFFKPLAADFGWDRATTSGIQSLTLICMGGFGIVLSWIADRFGTARTLAVCGSMAGLGLVLTSRITSLWQIYLTYSLMTGIGIGATFAVTGITTARWFVKRRGMALGIVASGVGLGQMLGVVSIAHVIETYGWSRAYLVMGIVAWVIIGGVGALLLRRAPEQMGFRPYGMDALTESEARVADNRPGNAVPVSAALRSAELWIMIAMFLLFTLCNQVVMVHMVNYATDIGIAPLVAATLVSTLGASNTAGRILMGTASDRIGGVNTMIIACLVGAAGLVWITFARELWMLYVFTVVYGFAFGAEVPQQPALVSKFFGLRVVLVGVLVAGSNTGGALGGWMGGWVFDATQSYQLAFLIGVVALICALVGALVLRRRRQS